MKAIYLSCLILLAAFVLSAQTKKPPKPSRPGIKNVQVPFSSLVPSATFDLGGHPDRLAITADAVWVANGELKAVHRIDPATNKVVARVDLKAEPCSGLVAAFGSLWIPLCGDSPALARVDLKTNAITAILPVGPADPEGGITASDDSIWLVTDNSSPLGTLSRIDPQTNGVRQKIKITGGSANPLFHEGSVWITGTSDHGGWLTEVDARTGQLLYACTMRPQPRFLTTGAGAIWILNQGDGTLSRFEIIEGGMKAVTTIEAGIPGPGGEICFDGSSVWVSVFGIPLTRIDSHTNEVTRQWTGEGGNSVSCGHGSLWLTGHKQGKLWRIPVPGK
ncbi:MAG: hypothetical protein LAP21_09685 [Acidobacteriia bacterium]|nr:hypothetical protein [Terriglobia bacterium]